MPEFSLIVPYYRNCEMLERQVEEWNKYPDAVKVICVDDGSPEPALPIIQNQQSKIQNDWLSLYRVAVDIPWNRGGARNLGAHVATTEWIVHIDIDHILPADSARAILESPLRLDKSRWYRFLRWRRGRADETRKKDKIPSDQEYGQIHPHVDSYLISRKLYWKIGGYDEDYSGSLGGGNPFLHQLEALAGPPDLLPAPIRLEVYTRSEVKDASDFSLSRDPIRYKQIKREKERTGNMKAKNPLRFPWRREL